jgi:predicted nuclease with TOPRIM domain
LGRIIKSTVLQAIINGQSSLKQDLLKEIGTVRNEVGSLKKELTDFRKENKSEHEKMNKRMDKLGEQLSYLEDDAPTT